MSLTNTTTVSEQQRGRALSSLNDNTRPQSASAVSWGAILAGAAGAASLSLIMVMLGTGLGFSSVSPWSHDGVTATTLGLTAILWLTLTQLLASGMGGYLAGRLRTKWVEVHTDEVYFRDTAHGFLAWSIATLATAAFLASAIGSIVSGGVQAGASVVGAAASTATVAAAGAATAAGSEMDKSGSDNGPMNYFVDYLFRKDMAASEALPSDASHAPTGVAPAQVAPASSSVSAPVAEVGRIFMNTLHTGTLPPEDVRYVGQIVAQRTGLSQQEAEKRVADTYGRLQAKVRDAKLAAQDAADKARKAAAYTTLWLFISLLIGAFIASLSATFGGRNRDA